MVKKLANKSSKELLADTQIRELGLNVGDFSPSWQGRIHFLQPEKSFIAHQMGVAKKGEYALKVR